jgi:5-methylcytosine-specific restriction endonuclease McrA
MTIFRVKKRVLRLAPDEFRQLRGAVLERDSWRCQSCGRCRDLQVHHKQFRSRSGEDRAENLITLCNDCHSRLHEAQQGFHEN